MGGNGMEREPTLITEPIKVQFDGETHRGQRVVLIVSDTEIRQEVRYKALRKVDPASYHQAEADFMRAISREMLWRLVREWKAEGAPKAEVASRQGGRRTSPLRVDPLADPRPTRGATPRGASPPPRGPEQG